MHPSDRNLSTYYRAGNIFAINAPAETSGMGNEIRKYLATDKVSLQDVLPRSLKLFYEAYVASKDETHTSPGKFKEIWHSPMLLNTDTEAFYGAIFSIQDINDGGRDFRILVPEEHRGGGVGRTLIGALEKLSMHRNYISCGFAPDQGTSDFFSKLGFSIEESGARYLLAKKRL